MERNITCCICGQPFRVTGYGSYVRCQNDKGRTRAERAGERYYEGILPFVKLAGSYFLLKFGVK